MTTRNLGHEPSEERRSFLSSASSWMMAGGLAAGYGTFAYTAGQFLFLNQPADANWMFVTDLQSFPVGKSTTFRAPAGQTIIITRIADSGLTGDFIALSDVCPHLGCHVHWELQNQRFFCPCHNGAFDASGKPLEGPPKDANQSLPTYPLMVEKGLLFIDVPSRLI